MFNEEHTESGTIKSISNNIAIVTRTNPHNCTACKLKSLCNLYEKPEIEIETDEHFDVGDTVDIFITPKARILSSLLVFILPILILFFSFCISYFLLDLPEPVSIIISFLSGIPSYFILKKVNDSNLVDLQIFIKKREQQDENTP